jgi:ubiquinone/menaquinone biosynthesis C-methylase UbiE
MKALQLVCPTCRGAAGMLNGTATTWFTCSVCGRQMPYRDGILCALTPERSEYFEPFLRDYSAIRSAEGRGSDDPAFYRSLPFQDVTQKNGWQWQIRAKTYEYLTSQLLPADAMDIADLGAGNCWLSYRLRELGRNPVAVDLSTDAQDGLGAARHYPHPFPLVQAEFDQLPFADRQFDLVIFNASLHYSTDYRRTLVAALRCLRPGGKLMVLDSPLYKLAEHGEQMRAEKHRQFQAQYGFASDALPSQEYLHEMLLAELSRDLRVRWTIHQPWYGWKWHLRPWKARLKRLRPPSRFCILVAQPQNI